MCGLFGFVGRPDMDVLRAIAVEAAARGPHAWGFAADLGVVKGLGSLRNNLHRLDGLASASWCIGNARMATFGAVDTSDSQPITVRGVSVVHNGNIYAAPAIMQRLGYMPATGSDTEALAAALAKGWSFWDVPTGGVAQAAIWKLAGDPCLYAVSAGHPLLRAEDAQGTVYLCSREAPVLRWEPLTPGRVTAFAAH